MVGNRKNYLIRYVIATFLLLLMVYPFIYLVLNSFADWSQIDKKFIPSDFTLRSYEWLFAGGEAEIARPWIHAFFNSAIVSLGSTFLMMLIGVLAAFALSKLNFKGRN